MLAAGLLTSSTGCEPEAQLAETPALHIATNYEETASVALPGTATGCPADGRVLFVVSQGHLKQVDGCLTGGPPSQTCSTLLEHEIPGDTIEITTGSADESGLCPTDAPTMSVPRFVGYHHHDSVIARVRRPGDPQGAPGRILHVIPVLERSAPTYQQRRCEEAVDEKGDCPDGKQEGARLGLRRTWQEQTLQDAPWGIGKYPVKQPLTDPYVFVGDYNYGAFLFDGRKQYILPFVYSSDTWGLPNQSIYAMTVVMP